MIMGKIMANVSTSGVYSILFDETSDVSGSNMMSIIVWYWVQGEIHEDFVGFYNTLDIAEKMNFFENEDEKKLTGIVIGKIVEHIVTSLGLDLALCVSFGSDGAAALTSKEKGAIAYLKSKAPYSVHSYCLSHTLNLCVSSMTGKAEIDLVINQINKICCFFK